MKDAEKEVQDVWVDRCTTAKQSVEGGGTVLVFVYSENDEKKVKSQD